MRSVYIPGFLIPASEKRFCVVDSVRGMPVSPFYETEAEAESEIDRRNAEAV